MTLSLSFPTVLSLLSLFSLVLLHGDAFPVHYNHPLRHHHHPRFATHNYRDALTKSILFFEGQRSGKLPSNQRMSWRKDSGLSDGFAMHVDLVGGYYDAGDNVKFGFPMAFTTTMLSWSVIEFGGLMKGELQNAREAIRWATDYLLKATAHPDTIYVQVGDAKKDHACWERPEDMDTPRSVFKVDVNAPGSEVAAETAAALAAASLVFRRSDPTYSNILVRRAIRVFQFADKHRGSYSNALKPFACPFYCSYSGYQDELLWGKIQCSAGFSVMNSQSPNPNILVGAIVGGPDQHDRFPDERSDYEQSEPATYINAPLVGALAYLAHSFGQL